MTDPTRCGRCGTAIAVPIEGDLRCPNCGTQHARHDFSPTKFPLTIKLYSSKTGELLWARAVTLDEARGLAKVEIPGYGGTEHYPVRVEIEYADGTTEVGGMT